MDSNWDPVAALKVKLLLVALASKMEFSFGPPRRANVAIAAAEARATIDAIIVIFFMLFDLVYR